MMLAGTIIILIKERKKERRHIEFAMENNNQSTQILGKDSLLEKNI
jgi:hypothetical protein